MGPIEVTA
ncbi:Protein of unknown function [Propionibacterium freudenreichii]|nr:Protein of unknown function [Propionibacterium freudenreichii]